VSRTPGPASLPPSLAGSPRATREAHHLEQVMGTVVTIDVYGVPWSAATGSPPDVTDAIRQARAILHRVDEVFSTWKAHSPVSRLRRGEISLAEAPPEVAEVLEHCAEARELTGGWFDPWVMPGGIDPTGYVKGWAAQRALAAFQDRAVSGVLVNAAGDIASRGGMPGGAVFRVGITDPVARDRLAEVIELTGAVATSGTYERGCHLVDPWTGEPASRAASATVTGPDLGLADALATGLAVAGTAELGMVERLDGYEALLIGHSGTRTSTSGFPFARRS
jgi:thiamine biosynthesis lipoprotein